MFNKDKYLVDVDGFLKSHFSKQASNQFPEKIPFTEEGVQAGKFRKIAFDAYRVDNDPYEGLWLLQDIDGQPHLVRDASFDISDKQEELSSSGWTVRSNLSRDNITLSYNKFPIAAFSSDEYGFDSADIMIVKSSILDNIESDPEFLLGVLRSQPKSKQLTLASSFPEFRKILFKDSQKDGINE